VLELLKRRQVPTRVVMYSGHHVGSATAVRCIRAGACDYFEKGMFEPAEQAARLRRYVILESTLIDRGLGTGADRGEAYSARESVGGGARD